MVLKWSLVEHLTILVEVQKQHHQCTHTDFYCEAIHFKGLTLQWFLLPSLKETEERVMGVLPCFLHLEERGERVHRGHLTNNKLLACNVPWRKQEKGWWAFIMILASFI